MNTRTYPKGSEFAAPQQAAASWATTRPQGRLGQTAKLIHASLQNIQTQSLPPAEYFRTLEALRNNAHYVTVNMRKHFAGQTYPLPDKLLRIAAACRAIYDAMSSGYSAIHAAIQHTHCDNAIHITSLHRAIYYLGQSLINTYEVYTSYHEQYWQQLHQLYWFAEQHALLDKPVIDALQQNSTIKHEYLKTILLYMAEPYQLRNGEIDQVISHLPRWQKHIQLQRRDTIAELAVLEAPIIDLKSDQPPQTVSNIDEAHQADTYRVINTNNLIELLQQEQTELVERQQSLQSIEQKSPITIGLLRRLIESWGLNKRRRFPRQQVRTPINATLGLHNTHMQLVYENHLAQTATKKHAYSGFHQKPALEMTRFTDMNPEQDDIWTTVYAWANDNTTQTPQQSATPNILDYRVKQDNWTLLNESTDGFCLMCADTQHEQIQIGDLVSIQRKDQTNRRLVGMVRWLKPHGQNGIEIGAMLLAQNATPISLIVDDSSGDKIVDRGLILPLLQILNRPESLITFSQRHQPGDILQITQTGKPAIKIKLFKLIYSNEVLNQFLFTPLADDTTNDDTKKTSDTFEDVWSSL